MRFALLKVKMALAYSVVNYEISLKPGFVLNLSGTAMQSMRPGSNGLSMVFKKI